MCISNLINNNDSSIGKFAGNRFKRSDIIKTNHENFWLIQNLLPTARGVYINNQKLVGLVLQPLQRKHEIKGVAVLKSFSIYNLDQFGNYKISPSYNNLYFYDMTDQLDELILRQKSTSNTNIIFEKKIKKYNPVPLTLETNSPRLLK